MDGIAVPVPQTSRSFSVICIGYAQKRLREQNIKRKFGREQKIETKITKIIFFQQERLE